MENWKDVPGYEGLYQVSDLGNVRRVETGRVLKPGKAGKSKDYLVVNLSKNGKIKGFLVHQLIAIVFLKHVPDGMKITVDHINENKSDNRLENLQLLSQRQNKTKSIDKTKTTSKFIGVCWHIQKKKWVVSININGKRKYLGHFYSEEQAHEAYQNVLKKLEADKTI
jgi:hypothetical protein